MTKDDLFEEIRARLAECPLRPNQDAPWHFEDAELERQVRSGFRVLSGIGFTPSGAMDATGDLTAEPTDAEGIFLADFVARRLLSGEQMQRLLEEAQGIYFAEGSEVIDTRQAGRLMQGYVTELRGAEEAQLAVLLAGRVGADASVYGGPTTRAG